MEPLTQQQSNIVGISSVKQHQQTHNKVSKNATKLVSPVGTAVYPKLVHPDTAFDEAGVYSCKLHVTKEEFEAFKAQVDPLVEAAYKAECDKQGKEVRKAPSTPVRLTPEGDFEIFAKQKAKVITRNGETLEFSVPLFDSQVKPILDKPRIGSGSKIRMSMTFNPWFVSSQGWGYTLRLREAQVLELVEYSSGGGGGSFSASDDGYTTTGETFGEVLADDAEEKVSPF